jgi:hypothetical protein
MMPSQGNYISFCEQHQGQKKESRITSTVARAVLCSLRVILYMNVFHFLQVVRTQEMLMEAYHTMVICSTAANLCWSQNVQ